MAAEPDSQPRRVPIWGRRIRAWFRLRPGARLRAALAAAAVVAVASVLCGVALVVAARLILNSRVDQAVGQRATRAATALADPQGGLATATRSSPRDRTLIQVVGPGGRVLAASDAVHGVAPLSSLRPRSGQLVREQRRLAVAHNQRFRIVAVGVNTADGPRTVLAAQSLDEVDDGTEAVVGALGIGLPMLTIVVGAATFVFVGRTLRPVDAMRRQADTITGRSLHTRLPVPAADDEIAALATTMNTMLDRIQAATDAQRRFIADASHELRSPLATIHAGLDLLEAADLPPPAAAHLVRMHRESDRMRRLITDMLLLARFDESSPPLRREDVDLDDVVYAERDHLAAEHPGLRITAQVAPIRVTGDPHHLQRALRNLTDNAARHARHHVSIGLRRLADPRTAEMTVSDDGPGVTTDDLERIFGRFVRVGDDRSRHGGGTGLGLPIARDIITAHGGTLVADRAGGRGLRVRILLPAHPPGPP